MNEIIDNQELNELITSAFVDGYDEAAVEELLTEFYRDYIREARTQLIEQMSKTAKKYKLFKRFKEHLKLFQEEYIQEQIQANVKGFAELTTAPKGYEYIKENYNVGNYIVNDRGIFVTDTDKNGDFLIIPLSSQPIVILERMRNVKDDTEKVVVGFTISGQWQTVTVEREMIANNTKLIRIANYGIDVTTENAKQLISYFRCIMQKNINTIPISNTVEHIGWNDNSFIPYSDTFKCDTVNEFVDIYKSIKADGDYNKWLAHCLELRKNIYVRLTMAASFASQLIYKVGGLPFVVHLWGDTGTGKSVALCVAASIWGKSDSGFVKSLNGTVYGINETAAFLYSFPCFLDELQTIEDKTKLNSFIMCMTEGMSRTQGAAQGGIRQAKQWKNCFICTGEEDIIKENSGGGTVNRVISLEVQNKIIDDGNYTMGLIRQNYGFAGKMFIDKIQNTPDIQERYNSIFKRLTQETSSTDKQCMAMAMLLLADELATECIFTGETPLKIDDVKMFLATKKQVDIAERCYEWVLNWAAAYQNRFENSSFNNGEIWGKIEADHIMINKNVLTEHMKQAGFDYGAIMPRFAKKGYIEKDGQGKFTHSRNIYGQRARYVKLLTDDFEEIEDNNCPFTS